MDFWSISAKISLEPGVAGNRLLGTVPQDQTRTFSLRGAGGDHPKFDVTRPLQSTVDCGGSFLATSGTSRSPATHSQTLTSEVWGSHRPSESRRLEEYLRLVDWYQWGVDSRHRGTSLMRDCPPPGTALGP